MEDLPTKVCVTCKSDLSESEFYPRSDSTDGLRSECINCNSRRNAWRREMAVHQVALAKLEVGCVSCDGYFGSEELELIPVDDEELYRPIDHMLHYSMDRIMEEFGKYQVSCNSCSPEGILA